MGVYSAYSLVTFIWLTLRPHGALAAENLFLRKQLAMYQERKLQPSRPDTPIRIALVLLSMLFNWRDALIVVQPHTLVRWHRQGFRLFWRWKSKPGRPPILSQLSRLIREMALSNPSWGEERIANELLLKLGIQISPRTVRKYLPKCPPGRSRNDQRWSTFVRNHAAAILACDYCVVVTVTFRLLYVFVVIEHQTRRIVHCNVTAHPTAAWTLQQLRCIFRPIGRARSSPARRCGRFNSRGCGLTPSPGIRTRLLSSPRIGRSLPNATSF
jgi:putative transposase